MNPYFDYSNDEQETVDYLQMQYERELDEAEEMEAMKKKQRAKRKAANPKRGLKCSIRKDLPF